jgi:O-antigen/teichoic acid export membrane protein
MERRTAQLRARLTTLPVVTSGLSLMTGTILTSGLGLVFWIVAARLFDRADFGVATTSIYTMMMLADVASLGLRSGLVRYLPGAGRATGPMILWGYGLAFASSGLTGIGFLIGLDWWAAGLGELRATALTFAFFALATACWALFNLQDAVLMAQRRAPWVPLENGLFGLLKIALLFPFAAWSPRLGILWAWTVPVFPIVVGVNLLIARQVRARVAPTGQAGAAELRRRMMSFSVADWMSSIARLAALVVVPLMVLDVEGDVAAGHFQAAWIIGFTVFTLSVNAAHALLSENSHDQADQLDTERRNTMQAGLLSLALTVPITLVGLIGAPLLLLVYGPDFADNSSGLLRILLVAAIPNAVYQVLIGRLRSQGRMTSVIVQETLLSLIVIVLSWLLLPSMGIEGVGVAWLVGLVALAAIGLAGARRQPAPGSPSGPAAGPAEDHRTPAPADLVAGP